MLTKKICNACLGEHGKAHWRTIFQHTWESGSANCPVEGHLTELAPISKPAPEWCPHRDEHEAAERERREKSI